MQPRRASRAALFAAAAMSSSAALAADKFWDGLVSSTWTDTANWEFGEPGMNDSAVFDPISVNPLAILSANRTISGMRIHGVTGSGPMQFQRQDSALLTVSGDVSLQDDAGAVKFDGFHASANEVIISGNSSLSLNGGAQLTATALELVNAGSAFTVNNGTLVINTDITLPSGTLTLNSGGTINLTNGDMFTDGGHIQLNRNFILPAGRTIEVTTGGDLASTEYLDIGTTGAGTFLVTGPGSTVNVGSGTALRTDWGNNAGTANVTIEDQATVTYNRGLTIGSFGGSAVVNLNSNGSLTVHEFLTVGGAGTANVTLNGGRLQSNGTTVFQSGATVTMSAGIIDIPGDSTFSTGSTLVWNGGSFSPATVSSRNFDGGVASIAVAHELPVGSVLRVLNGGRYNVTSSFGVASTVSHGELLVSGTNGVTPSRITVTGTTTWASAGFTNATVTFSNSGEGTFGNLSIADSGGRALVNLSSGGRINVATLTVGSTSNGATINVAGGVLNTVGPAAFNSGAELNVQTGGSVIFGGNTTFNSGSKFNWSGGTWNNAAGTTIAFSGGAGSFTAGTLASGRGLSNTSVLQITNAGTVVTNSYFDIGSSDTGGAFGTMIVQDPGSSFTSTATAGIYSDWALNPTDFALVTFANSGVGSYNAGLQIGAEGGSAQVNIQSSAKLSTTNLLAGSEPFMEGLAGVSINVSGGTLTVNGSANLQNDVVVSYSAGSIGITGTLDTWYNSIVFVSTGGNKVLRVGGLNMLETSKIELTDNDMIIDYSGGSPLATVRGYIITGRNGGNWLGNRLTSSSAAIDPTHKSLGIGEASIVLGAGGGTFSGQAVDATTVLVKFTYLGDADLDGDVDVNDLGKLASSWQTAGPWTSGDFDYDGSIGVNDLGMLATNWQAGVGSPLGPALAEALPGFGLPGIHVPEPAQFGLLLGAAVLSRRRPR
jgi:hypothetical protein